MQPLEVGARAIRALESSLQDGFRLSDEFAATLSEDLTLARGPDDDDLQIAAARRLLRVSRVQSRRYMGRHAYRVGFDSPSCSEWSQVLVFDEFDQLVHLGWNFVPEWVDERGRSELEWSISDSIQARLGFAGFWQRLKIDGITRRSHTYYVDPMKWSRWNRAQRSAGVAQLREMARDRERTRGYEGPIDVELVSIQERPESPIMSSPSGKTSGRVHHQSLEPESIVITPDWTSSTDLT